MALVQAPSFCKMDLAEQKTQPYSWQIGRDSVVDCLTCGGPCIPIHTPVGMWHMPAIPSLSRMGQEDQGFNARLSYIVSTKPVWAT